MRYPDIKALFKFFPVSVNSFAALSGSYLFHSAPSGFNDPFDCYARIKTLVSRGELEDFLAVQGKGKSVIARILARHKARSIFGTRNVLDILEIPKLAEAVEEYRRNFHQKCGVACLSERYDHPLMWAHYASGHAGFCLGFRRVPGSIFGGDTCDKVRYVDEIEEVSLAEILNSDPSGPIHTEIARAITHIKHRHWQYEAEWRLFHIAENVKIGYFAEDLTMVIFGSRMCADHRDILRKILLSSHHVKFFEASPVEGGRNVVIRQIE